MVTAVALSGGIDSLVAAYLLKQEKIDIFGIHFLTGFESEKHRNLIFDNSESSESINSINWIADQLGIEIHIIDIRQAFREKVVDYFTRTYASGKTPNPCMVCNAAIKFGIILKEAEKLGADSLATGHYARTDFNGQELRLKKGVDPDKDQSYFLAMLHRDQLTNARFPLGRLLKSEVRQIAASRGLTPISKEESQDICFIPDGAYRNFLESRLDEPSPPGFIIDTEGTILGEHPGLFRFTVGQRRGINCPAAEPYYVLGLDVENNRLVVGPREKLYTDGCRMTGVNWIGSRPDGSINVQTRLRYRHRAVASTLLPQEGSEAAITFADPQAAVTPGQAAVCYQNDEVVAAGWIENP